MPSHLISLLYVSCETFIKLIDVSESALVSFLSSIGGFLVCCQMHPIRRGRHVNNANPSRKHTTAKSTCSVNSFFSETYRAGQLNFYVFFILTLIILPSDLP